MRLRKSDWMGIAVGVATVGVLQWMLGQYRDPPLTGREQVAIVGGEAESPVWTTQPKPTCPAGFVLREDRVGEFPQLQCVPYPKRHAPFVDAQWFDPRPAMEWKL